jgi:hypothetical protein
VLIEQLVESVRRIEYVKVMRKRPISPGRADPANALFDPLKAAVIRQRQGDIEEAFWFVFLFVHFGRHAKGGYRYAREVFGRLGGPGRWDWASTSSAPTAFRAWLDGHHDALRRPGVPGGFGNHRKYESLSGISEKGTGAVVESYVRWIGPPRTHTELFEDAVSAAGGGAQRAFAALYQSMAAVSRFGRTARFDYLTMVGNLGLSSIEPGSAYLRASTGPLAGARLLFGQHQTAAVAATVVDEWLVELDVELHVGMQVLEDALCNWQKSPNRFAAFRG